MNFVIALCVLYFAGWAVKKLWETSYSRRTGNPPEDLWRAPTPEEVEAHKRAEEAQIDAPNRRRFEALRQEYLADQKPLPEVLQNFEAFKSKCCFRFLPCSGPWRDATSYPGGMRAFIDAGCPRPIDWPKPTSAERPTGITPSIKIQQACVAPCVELPVAESRTQTSSDNAENVDEWPEIRLVRTSPPKVTDSIDAKDLITAFGYGEGSRFNLVTRKQFGTMLLRRKELDSSFQAGKTLSVEEQKERAILHFLLGTPGEVPAEEPIIELHKWRLEHVRGIRVIGEFTFGDLEEYAASHEGVLRFLDGIYEGVLTIKEAEQTLVAMKKWEGLKDNTHLSKEEFFAKELATITGTCKEQSSDN